eukprot:evm.model.scf_774EXC.3 EVM.evm.TU.scf_774EXC.3   scf_774EXC:55894-60344(+)
MPDAPVSVLTDIAIDGADYQDMKRNREWAARTQQMIVWLIRTACRRWTGYDSVASIMDIQQGSVVFQIQFDFRNAAAAKLFKEGIAPSASFIFQGSFALLALRPHSKIVILKEWAAADAQAYELGNLLQQTVHDMGQVANIAYNHRVMSLLQNMIDNVKRSMFQLPAGESEKRRRAWREHAAVLLHELKIALQLLKQHIAVDLAHLCRAADALATVKKTFSALCLFGHKWNVAFPVHFSSVLQADVVELDTHDLNDALAYVLKGKKMRFQGAWEQCRNAWEEAKRDFEVKRSVLPVIPTEAINWVSLIAEAVHEIEWTQAPGNSARMLAYCVAPISGEDMDLRNFAELYMEVHDQSLVDPEFVIQLRGVTQSGAVVTDKADGNLMVWYQALPKAQAESTLALKIGVLAQAARSLHGMHSCGIVVGEVKSTKFLVFQEDEKECIVKAAVPMLEDWHLNSCLSTKTGRWLARELYEGKTPSRKSDVFGFGVMMYEVLMEEVPYGQDTTEAGILEAKLTGMEPHRLPLDLKMQLPGGLLEIMHKCCSYYPEDRPEMSEVDSCLSKCCSCTEEYSSETSRTPKHVPGIPWVACGAQADFASGEQTGLEESASIFARGDKTEMSESKEKVDPLAAASTIFKHAQHIFKLAKAATTNTEECEAVWSRVEQLLDVVKRICQHPHPQQQRLVHDIEAVMDTAARVVENYSNMKRGVQRAVQILKTVHIQRQFEDVNASLDSMLQ